MLLSALIGGALCVDACLAESPAAKSDQSLTLPTDWRVGSRHRYRATWKREAQATLPHAEELVEGMRSESSGEVTVTVLKRSASGYVIRWKPELASASGTLTDPSDMASVAAALWRDKLSLPLELELQLEEGAWSWQVRDQAAVEQHVMQALTPLAKGLGIDCEGSEEPMCRKLAHQHATNTVFPLFNCVGLDLDTSQPMTWTQPHPNPSIADAVPIEYRREVIDFAPEAKTVHVRTVWAPNDERLRVWLRSKLGEISGSSSQPTQALSGMSWRFQTDCEMDKATGWPVVLEQRDSVGDAPVTGVEITTFERL